MTPKQRASFIIKDILINHLPRIREGLENGYVDENQILIIYDHAVRARILSEVEKVNAKLPKRKRLAYYEICSKCLGGEVVGVCTSDGIDETDSDCELSRITKQQFEVYNDDNEWQWPIGSLNGKYGPKVTGRNGK
jgi:hypothetical protein